MSLCHNDGGGGCEDLPRASQDVTRGKVRERKRLLLLRHQLLLLPLHLVLLLLLLLLLQRLVLLLLVQILVVVQVLVLVRIEFFIIIIIIFLHCMSCFVFQVTFREVDPQPQLCMKVILTVYFLTTHSLVLRYFYEAVFWTGSGKILK